MARAFIGMGSNLGERLYNLQRAVQELNHLPLTSVVNTSSVYETEPVGVKDQPDFLNAVVELETSLDAVELVRQLKKIEFALGRRSRERWREREIDLDLVYLGEVVLHDGGVDVPHPGRQSRKFVLEPLCELAPSFRDPETGKTIGEMLLATRDRSAVRRIAVQLVNDI